MGKWMLSHIQASVLIGVHEGEGEILFNSGVEVDSLIIVDDTYVQQNDPSYEKEEDMMGGKRWSCDGSVDLGAVDGGADGVRDADAALARDAGGLAGVEAADPGRGGLEAVAGGALVGGGLGGGVEAPDAAAARGRGGAAAGAAGVGEARADGGADLAAGDGGVGVGDEHRGHHKGEHRQHLTASHLDLFSLWAWTVELAWRWRASALSDG